MGKIAEIVDVTGCNSIEHMLRQSHTDWDIESLAAGHSEQGRGKVESAGFRALVRPDTNTALAYVGARYRTNSHRLQLGKLDHAVRSGMLLPQSVSVWDNGAILAYQFRVPELDSNIIGTDRVSTLLTIMHSYGFRVADMAFFCNFRAFCKNQMGAFARMCGEDRVRHRGDVETRFGDMLGKRITELGGEVKSRTETMRLMTGKSLSGRALAEYFGESVGATKAEIDQAWIAPPEDLRGTASKIPEVLECYAADDAGAAGTVWQAYNAVTRYGTHKSGRNEANRQRTMLMGAGGVMAARAWAGAAQLVAA